MRILPKEIEDIPVGELMLSEELCQSLIIYGYHTLGQLLGDDSVNTLPLTEELMGELATERTSLLKQVEVYFTGIKMEQSDSCGEVRPVEDNMCSHYCQSDDWLDLLFAETPLIGNRLIKDETKERLCKFTKEYIKLYVSGKQREFSLKAKQQITLAIIKAAQDWDPVRENNFWKYMSEYFGYGKKDQKLRQFFIECMNQVLDTAWRFRITDQEDNSSYNAHKATILVHALAPRRTWIDFCGLLFEFYRTELGGSYQEDDCRIIRMVEDLHEQCKKGAAYKDDALSINGKTYRFQEGLRKLILYRPGYMLRLIDYMLKTMDELLNDRGRPPRRYIDKILRLWFEEFLNPKEREILMKKLSAARQFAPRFMLYEERIYISCPDTLLGRGNTAEANLSLEIDGRTVYKKTLIVFDSKDGKVVGAFQKDITSYLSFDDGMKRVHLMISSNEDTIYDSKDYLHRSLLCFQGEKEMDVHRCQRGDYVFLMAGNDSLMFQHAEETELQLVGWKRSVFVRLEAGFEILLNGQKIAGDYAEEIAESNLTDNRVPEESSIEVEAQKFKVDSIVIRDEKWKDWPQKDYLWADDIKRDAILYVFYPKGISCELWLADIKIKETQQGEFELGKAVAQYSPSGEASWAKLRCKAWNQQETQERTICSISRNERFIQRVKFEFKKGDKALYWNLGGGFVGSREGDFQLVIQSKKGEEVYREGLELDNPIVVREITFPKGRYLYRIERKSTDLFELEPRILEEGTIEVGSKDELNFQNCVLKINDIICKWYGHEQKNPIFPVYIDQLAFQGKQWVETEKNFCPSYSGILFFYNQRKERCEFSFSKYTDEKGKSYYKVNPVTIADVGDNKLKITLEDGDIYYYRDYNRKKGENTYYIVDHIPDSSRNKEFFGVPIYFLYKKEEVSC